MRKMGYQASPNEVLAVRDLWSHTNNGTTTDGLAYLVPGGGASVLLKLTKKDATGSFDI